MQNRNPQNRFLQETGINNTDVTTWALPEGAIARLGRGIAGPLEFSPDGKYLAFGTKIGLWWYELATMKPVALWETERGMVFRPQIFIGCALTCHWQLGWWN